MTLPSSLQTNVRIYQDPNAGSSEPLLAGYKGSIEEVVGFYCPYIPLSIASVTPMAERVTVEVRVNQGGYFDAVGVLTVNDRHTVHADLLTDIHVWCLERWGAPGFEAPARWYKDRELIFCQDSNMLFELKMRWHGVTV